MAAVANNGIGTAGIGRNIQIMNLRVGGDPEHEGEKSVELRIALSQAIRYAIRNGARVIVCTIGTMRDAEGNVEAAVKEAEKSVSCS